MRDKSDTEWNVTNKHTLTQKQTNEQTRTHNKTHSCAASAQLKQ